MAESTLNKWKIVKNLLLKERNFLILDDFYKELVLGELQEAINCLNILQNIKWTPKAACTGREDIKGIELESVQDEDCLEIFKIQRDCASLEKILIAAYDQIKHNASYKRLVDIIEKELNLKKDLNEIETSYNGHVEKLEALIKLKDQELNRNYEQEMLYNIGKIKDNIQDFKIESGIKLKYVKSWENSKIEQNELENKQKLEKANAKLNDSLEQLKNEEIVHEEICTFLEDQINELEMKIEQWKVKIIDHKTNLEKQCEDANEKLRKLQANKQSLIDTMEKEKMEIDDWLAYKERKRAAELEMERALKAAEEEKEEEKETTDKN